MYKVDLNSDLGSTTRSSRMFPLSMWPVAITQEIRW